MVSIVSNEKVAQVILQPANLLAVSSPTPESIRSSDIKVKIKQTPSMRDRQMKIIKPRQIQLIIMKIIKNKETQYKHHENLNQVHMRFMKT